jgi:hypothetical protein
MVPATPVDEAVVGGADGIGPLIMVAETVQLTVTTVPVADITVVPPTFSTPSNHPVPLVVALDAGNAPVRE